MAIVKAPALSLDASGNLGAICYSKWRGLSVARGAWTGTVPNTPAQQTIQGYLTTISQAWSGALTESFRQAWRDAAKSQVRYTRLSTKYVPSGYQYYMETNFVIMRMGGFFAVVPPPAMEPNGLSEYTLSYDDAMFEVWISCKCFDEALVADARFEVWKAGPYDGGGRHALPGEYRFLTYGIFFVTETDANVVADKYYWYKVRFSHFSGRTGGWEEKQVYIPL